MANQQPSFDGTKQEPAIGPGSRQVFLGRYALVVRMQGSPKALVSQLMGRLGDSTYVRIYQLLPIYVCSCKIKKVGVVMFRIMPAAA